MSSQSNTPAKIAKELRNAGFNGLFVHKAEGIWYLLGDEGVVRDDLERCLHVVRLADLTSDIVIAKAEELCGRMTP